MSIFPWKQTPKNPPATNTPPMSTATNALDPATTPIAHISAKRKFGRTFDYAQYIVWGVLVGMPLIILAKSNFDVFPDAIYIASMLLLMTGVASLVLHYYTSSQDPTIRHFALGWELLISLLLWVEVGSHHMLGRDVSAARQAVEAHRVDQDRAQQRIKEQLDGLKALAAAETARARAEANAAANEARRLSMLPVGQRASRPAVRSAGNKPPTANALPAVETIPGDTGLTTPDKVARKYSIPLWVLALMHAGLSMIGLTILRHLFKWDANKDGVPDYVQRLPLTEVLASYPQYYSFEVNRRQMIPVAPSSPATPAAPVDLAQLLQQLSQHAPPKP